MGKPGQYQGEVIGKSNEKVFSFEKSDTRESLVLIFAGGGISLLICFAGCGLIVYGIVKFVTKKSNG